MRKGSGDVRPLAMGTVWLVFGEVFKVVFDPI